MDFKNPFFLISLVTGLTYIIAGWAMIRFPPKWPNHLYGYRTSRAMNNESSWNFAQRYSAKEMIKVGMVFLLVAASSSIIPVPNVFITVAISLLLFILLIYPIITTERALKKFEKKK